MINALVTDRTAADLARWLELRNKGYAKMTEAERAEWGAGMKGAYNASDLNRVGEAMNYIRDRLVAAHYSCEVVSKTDWTAADIPTAADLTAYLDKVACIREALAQFATTPATPTYTGGLDYQEANDIEQILIDIDKLVSNMLAARNFCGELYSGEV
jgi:hypothetical protein